MHHDRVAALSHHRNGVVEIHSEGQQSAAFMSLCGRTGVLRARRRRHTFIAQAANRSPSSSKTTIWWIKNRVQGSVKTLFAWCVSGCVTLIPLAVLAAFSSLPLPIQTHLFPHCHTMALCSPAAALCRTGLRTHARTFATSVAATAGDQLKHVAVVGSGPAGFYTAKYLLQQVCSVGVSWLVPGGV